MSAKKDQKKIILYLFFFGVLPILRILLGYCMGISFNPEAGVDDALLARYSLLREHFQVPNTYSMVKSMSYPLFLEFVNVSHLPYQLVYALVFFAAALLLFFFVKKVSGRVGPALLIYVWFLFLPAGFENMLSYRLYRNGLLIPMTVIVVGLSMHLMYDLLILKEYKKKQLFESILLGLTGTFTVYIKEDGAWLLASMLFFLAVILAVFLIGLVRKKRERSALIFVLAVCILPGLLYGGLTAGYKKLNEHFFGVAEIETRTHGELGDFVANVYSIHSDARSDVVWAPADAIEKAFSASPTLSSHPELKEAVWHSNFYPDLDRGELPGDYLTWLLRMGLERTGMFTSEKEVSDLFSQVNRELKAAFEDGTLERETELFRPFSASAGRTREETLKLVPETFRALGNAIVLKGYEPGGRASVYDLSIEPEFTALLAKRTHSPEILTNEPLPRQQAAERVIPVLFWIYRVVNVLFAAFACFLFVWNTILMIRKKETRTGERIFRQSAVFALFGIALVYAFCICWFCSFMLDNRDSVLMFYTPGVPALLAVIYSLSAAGLYEEADQWSRGKTE